MIVILAVFAVITFFLGFKYPYSFGLAAILFVGVAIVSELQRINRRLEQIIVEELQQINERLQKHFPLTDNKRAEDTEKKQ